MPGSQGVGASIFTGRASLLKDSRLNIDNNPAERLNRGIAIIRKNCLFAGSEAGGQRLAILYSFAATCKANGICFRKWLEDVLPRLNATPSDPQGRSKIVNELRLIIMKRGMPSGAQTPDGIIFLLALIFSKAPPRYPPHHGAHWAYTNQLENLR